MQPITLGLDIGQYSIKGVRPKKKGLFRRRPGTAFEKIVPRDQGGDPFTLLSPAQQTTLKELVAEGAILPSDTIAVSLPGHLISTREITLPFTDTQKIRKTIYYEAERQLPFNVEEAVIDYQFLARSETTTRVLVYAAPKTMLKDYLATLLSVGIDPVIVSVDQVALYHAIASNPQEKKPLKERSGLMVDLGATKTVLCAIHRGEFDWGRTTPTGADLFVDTVKEEYNLSWKEAEQYMARLDLSEETADSERLANRLGPWATDMEVSLTKVEPGSPLHLFGGTPASVGKIVSDTLHREVITSPNGSWLGGGRFSQATGLTLLSPQAINFRKGGWAHHQEKIQGKQFIPIGIMALLMVVLASLQVHLHAQQKEEKLKTLKIALRREFAAAFPDVKNIVSEVKQAETAVSGLRKQSDFLGIGVEAPLMILKQITEAIPAGVKIYITECDVEQRKVQIAAQTTSFNAVDQIQSALMRVRSFENVTVSDTQVMEDTARVSFRIQISLKTTQAIFQGER